MAANSVYPTFLALGAGSIVTALFLWYRTRLFVSQALPASGTVIGMEESRDEGVSYSPIVQFTASTGEEIVFTDSVSTNPPGYKIGDPIKVLYHRENFSNARVASVLRMHMLSIVFGGLALIFLAIAVIGMWG